MDSDQHREHIADSFRRIDEALAELRAIRHDDEWLRRPRLEPRPTLRVIPGGRSD
jgi:hypothetical protein